MEPGIKKLTEAVKRDCREGQGCFNPNGCDHEFIRHVPETDPSMIRLGQKTKCIKVSKYTHKYCDKYKWILDRAEEYAEALGVTRDDVLNGWEKYRNYWYMNYYQDSKQPSLKGDQKVIKIADWLKELRSRFGEDDEDWKFVCPSCGHVQSVADFKAIGVDGTKAYYECISRYKNIDGKTNKKACKYTLCGLFVLDHDTVISNEFLPVNVFKMADVPGESKHTD